VAAGRADSIGAFGLDSFVGVVSAALGADVEQCRLL